MMPGNSASLAAQAIRRGCRAPRPAPGGAEARPGDGGLQLSEGFNAGPRTTYRYYDSRERDSPGSRPAVFQSSRPLVFAHRGGATLAPENTMPAFDNGMAFGADGLELDVHLAADGVPVVIHDATLDRTTDRTGPVAALTSDELARVDAGYRFARDGSHPFRGTGAGVPTLEAVLRRFPDTRVIIEMKGASAGPGAGGRVGRPPRRRRGSRVPQFLRAGDLRHGSRRGAGDRHQRIAGRGAMDAPPVLDSVALGGPPTLRGLPGARARRAGCGWCHRPSCARRTAKGRWCRCGSWTTPADISRLLGWGVDGLITDRPDVATDAVRRWVER